MCRAHVVLSSVKQQKIAGIRVIEAIATLEYEDLIIITDGVRSPFPRLQSQHESYQDTETYHNIKRI